jgi:phosphoserine phosphatase
MAAAGRKRLLCLFDVDGTLTQPRLLIEPAMQRFMEEEVRRRW